MGNEVCCTTDIQPEYTKNIPLKDDYDHSDLAALDEFFMAWFLSYCKLSYYPRELNINPSKGF